MKFFNPSVRITNQKPRAFVSVLYPFVCCFCFVRAFSFQDHTKIALINSVCPPKFCISYCLQMLLGKRSTQLPEASLYPDVSLSRWKFARKGGREEEKRASPRLRLPSYSLPMVTSALSPVTRVSRSPLGCKIMRKTKRLKRRQSQEHLKTVVYALFGGQTENCGAFKNRELLFDVLVVVERECMSKGRGDVSSLKEEKYKNVEIE